MEKTTESGILLPLLTTLFVGLKLTGNIDWSWVWVLSPLWVPFAIAAAVLVIGFFVFLILETVK